MGGMRHLTDPEMFRRFHELLTAGRPGYEPWYFLLSKADKDPELTRGSWKSPKARLTTDEAIKFMRKGHNIGIAATSMDGLCIIDIDDIEVTPDSIMKPTLSVRSRKRIGMHYFYWTTDPLCKKVIPTAHEGEMRALWSYVVAPGSFVPCSDEERDRIPEDDRERAGRYTVKNAVPTSGIEWKEVPPIFKKQIKEEKRLKKEKRGERKKKAATKERTQNDSALFDLTFDDIASIPDESRFPSLFHASETGKNASINDDMMACWRHNVTLRPLQGLAVLAGVADCMSAGKGMPDSAVGDSTVDLSDPETLYTIWNYARDQGMIQNNDPMPVPARKWILEHPVTPVTRDIEAESKSITQFEVLNFELFRKLVVQYPGGDATMDDSIPGGAVYTIQGDDLIKMATGLDVIIPYIGDDGKAIILTSPEMVMDYISSCQVRKDGADTIYYISIRGEKIDFTAKELMDVSMWREKIIQCNLIISFDLKAHAKRDAWSGMVASILNAAEVTWEETLTEDDLMGDVIMGRIRRLPVVLEDDDFVHSRTVLDRLGMYMISTETLEDVLGQIMMHKRIGEIRRILGEYLVKNSEQKRFGGVRMSVWFFKKWGESDE